MGGQRRGQGAGVIIDDEDLAVDICDVGGVGQVSKKEFVSRIPHTKRFLRMRRIAREFEFALGHPQPGVGGHQHNLLLTVCGVFYVMIRLTLYCTSPILVKMPAPRFTSSAYENRDAQGCKTLNYRLY